MPVIIVKDYTWRQTAEEIIVKVPIKGPQRCVDIFALGNYVKMSCPPFILELFLTHEILDESSECVLSEELAVLTLKKSSPNFFWNNLVVDDLSKQKKSEIRNQAVEKSLMLAEQKRKQRGEKRQELQRQAVREQIDLDTKILNRIQVIRDSHRHDAMTEFENWRKNAEVEKKNCNDENSLQEEKNKELLSITEICDIEEDGKNKEIEKKAKENFEKDKKRGREIIKKIMSGEFRSERGRKILEDERRDCKPRPRESGSINVKFSERVFPTPARESHQVEEQEWLEKQAEARRKIGFSTDDLRPEEQDPMWLKDKGDEFFKAGNYLAAISAYTHGIKLSEKMSQLYANRSAAQYAIGNFRRCAEDCSTALELMQPKCEGNRESRARCHARLGAVLCKLSAPHHGIPEFEEALKLSPNNETIKNDLNEAKKFFSTFKN